MTHPALAMLGGFVQLSWFVPWTTNSFGRAGSNAASLTQGKSNRCLLIP